MSEAPDPGVRVGEVLGDRYELTAYMESGGVGHIYRAVDRRLEYRQVCVKVVKAHTRPDQLARFRREALLTGGLSSPHLVHTSDFGTLPDGQAYLVMEYLRGESLARLLEREGRLPRDRALHLIDGILAGLEAAHDAGVVHRDLKPENVFVVREPGVHDHVKLLDFGFAKVYGDQAPDLDVTGDELIVAGTVSYMAPEQLRGRPADHRTDLYAAAALLFRMLTGRLPYATHAPGSALISAARFRAVRLDEPPRSFSELDPALEDLGALEEVLHAALATDLDQRPSSAGEMRRLVADAMGGEQVTSEMSEPGASVERWHRSTPNVPGQGSAGGGAGNPVENTEKLDPAVAQRTRRFAFAGAATVALVFGWFIYRAASG